MMSFAISTEEVMCNVRRKPLKEKGKTLILDMKNEHFSFGKELS